MLCLPRIYRDRNYPVNANLERLACKQFFCWAHTSARLSQHVQRALIAVNNYGLSKLHAHLRGSRLEDSSLSNSDRNYPALPYVHTLCIIFSKLWADLCDSVYDVMFRAVC